MENLYSRGKFADMNLTRHCATCPTTAQWLNNPPSHYPASQATNNFLRCSHLEHTYTTCHNPSI